MPLLILKIIRPNLAVIEKEISQLKTKTFELRNPSYIDSHNLKTKLKLCLSYNFRIIIIYIIKFKPEILKFSKSKILNYVLNIILKLLSPPTTKFCI